jgi:hypothetical protein
MFYYLLLYTIHILYLRVHFQKKFEDQVWFLPALLIFRFLDIQNHKIYAQIKEYTYKLKINFS